MATVPGCGPAARCSGPWSAWVCGEPVERNGALKRELWPWLMKAAHEGFSGCYGLCRSIPRQDISQPMTHSKTLFGMAHLCSMIIVRGVKCRTAVISSSDTYIEMTRMHHCEGPTLTNACN